MGDVGDDAGVAQLGEDLGLAGEAPQGRRGCAACSSLRATRWPESESVAR